MPDRGLDTTLRMAASHFDAREESCLAVERVHWAAASRSGGKREGHVATASSRQAPALRPGDVVIMDSLSAHEVAGVREAIEAGRAELVYLPPYLSGLRPTEQLFAKLSATARTVDTRRAAIGALLETSEPDDCFRQAGSWPDRNGICSGKSPKPLPGDGVRQRCSRYFPHFQPSTGAPRDEEGPSGREVCRSAANAIFSRQVVRRREQAQPSDQPSKRWASSTGAGRRPSMHRH